MKTMIAIVLAGGLASGCGTLGGLFGPDDMVEVNNRVCDARTQASAVLAEVATACAMR